MREQKANDNGFPVVGKQAKEQQTFPFDQLVKYDGATNKITINANLTINGGTNIDGNFTANSIIENMMGYEFTHTDIEGYNFEYIYSGVCKNGNKITFVVFFNVIRTLTEGAGTSELFRFKIPKNVGEKLIPNSSLGIGIIGLKQVQAYSNVYTSLNVDIRSQKGPSSNYDYIVFGASRFNEMKLNTLYQIRFEQTFLLSDNLVQ